MIFLFSSTWGKKKDIKYVRTRIKMAFRRVIAGIALRSEKGAIAMSELVKIVHCRLI
jgi:hypothetical protein